MKKRFILPICLVLATAPAMAQLAFVLPMTNSSIRLSYAIQVSANKTTHIIFPYDIRYADLGSKDIGGKPLRKRGTYSG